MMPAHVQDFRRSRLRAEGWNAARNNSLGKPTPNPYPPGPDHEAWNEGFIKATGRRPS